MFRYRTESRIQTMEPHSSGPTEWATVPTNNGDVSIFMDPETEQYLEGIPDDASQPAIVRKNPISEASNKSLPPRQRHWMDTRLRTRTRAGGTRRYYQQFDSSTYSYEESSNVLLSSAHAETNEEQELATQPEYLIVPPVEMPLTPTNITENLFSEHEMIEAPSNDQDTQQPVNETGTSMLGTSAPLPFNPSLTDVLGSFPIWPQLDQPITHDPQATIPMSSQNLTTSSIGVPGHVSSATTQEKRKSKERPPASTTTSKNKPVQSRCRGMLKRGRPRGRPPKKAPIPAEQTASCIINI